MAREACIKRILVVDDHRDTAETLGDYFGLLGCEVRVAYSGHEAVRAAPDFQPHLIVLDINMPDMDGITAASAIKAQPWSRQAALVAHTGSSDPDLARMTRSLGFQHHVPKPADLGTFEAIVRSLDTEGRE
jgi:CheY-like chemotaxis protein